MLRATFLTLSKSQLARRMMTHFPPARLTARRFVAGETLDEAVAVVKDLNQRGIKAIINEVGESVTSCAEAAEAARAFHTILQRIDAEKLDATVSLKPSHIGLTFGEEECYRNVAEIVRLAQKLGIAVEIDIEDSNDVEATLRVYHRLLDEFGGGVRLALQAYLRRTPDDLQCIIARGGSARLVKGAYKEPADIAYQSREEIQQACQRLAAQFLTLQARETGAYLALGSHDPVLIDWLLREVEANGLPKDRFEVQMLLGIRRDEQQRLADQGYRVRIYVPYGVAWYPYFMRRLAEHPANAWLMARAMVGK
jgi:proline dehydrogenase